MELRERSEDEMRAFRTIERRTIMWAAVAGLLSGVIIGGVELTVLKNLLEGIEGEGWREQLPYWAGFMLFAGLVTVLEILFLYWNGLGATVEASRLAGLGLARPGRGLGVLSRGLGRAAMELPNPHAEVFGIDPFARTKRWKIYIWMLVYRAKVGVSSFALRILLRRILGRAALRTLVPLAAGPLYAAWNAAITRRIMIEVRVRAFGPMAVESLVRQVASACEGMSERDRALVVAAAGEMIIVSRDDHPNHVLLVGSLLDRLEISPGEVDMDWEAQSRRLGDLDEGARRTVLKVLIASAVLDHRLRRRHWRGLRSAHARGGLPLNEQAIERLRARLIEGRAMREEDFAAVWREAG